MVSKYEKHLLIREIHITKIEYYITNTVSIFHKEQKLKRICEI